MLLISKVLSLDPGNEGHAGTLTGTPSPGTLECQSRVTEVECAPKPQCRLSGDSKMYVARLLEGHTLNSLAEGKDQICFRKFWKELRSQRGQVIQRQKLFHASDHSWPLPWSVHCGKDSA